MKHIAVLCPCCGQPFTKEEWEARHSDYDGEDIHDDCCRREGPCAGGHD